MQFLKNRSYTSASTGTCIGQGKIRIEPHTQILDRLSRAERTTQDGTWK